MTCGSCGAVIADKAIVCYRCGASTMAAPTPMPKRDIATRRSPVGRLVVLLLGLALLTVGVILPPDTGTARDVTRLAGLALAILAAVRLLVRRR